MEPRLTSPISITKVSSWSWQDIFDVYKILGSQLEECVDIAHRFGIVLPLKQKRPIMYIGQQEFVRHLMIDVNRINNHLRVLDQEISRRNKLIGVMG